MENPEGLPSHYHFFTSLINSLSSRAPPQQASISNDDATTNTTIVGEEETKAKEHNRRKLLLTLHVLFPTLLLPALDLLDRHLVTRIRLGGSPAADSGNSQDGPAGTMTPLYVVRSVASTMSSGKRRPRPDSVASRSYLVRLAAWNCTCAGFTLDAFPPVPSVRVDSSASAAAGPEDETSDWWWSGGLSNDGMAEDAPCCKHLLACLLAERQVTTREGYLQTRDVTKDELAGLIAGI
jgi:hypothetical protein